MLLSPIDFIIVTLKLTGKCSVHKREGRKNVNITKQPQKKTTNQHKMQLTQRKNQFNTTTKLNKEKGNRKKSKQNKTNKK